LDVLAFEDEATALPRNIGTLSHTTAMSYHWRTESSATPVRKSQNCNIYHGW